MISPFLSPYRENLETLHDINFSHKEFVPFTPSMFNKWQDITCPKMKEKKN